MHIESHFCCGVKRGGGGTEKGEMKGPVEEGLKVERLAPDCEFLSVEAVDKPLDETPSPEQSTSFLSSHFRHDNLLLLLLLHLQRWQGRLLLQLCLGRSGVGPLVAQKSGHWQSMLDCEQLSMSW